MLVTESVGPHSIALVHTIEVNGDQCFLALQNILFFILLKKESHWGL